jgi:hypothetical protein
VVGYVVVAIFSVAYGIVRIGWPHVPEGRAVVVGILASGPIALALVWERLTKLKLFGVEVTLTEVTVRIDQRLDTVLMMQQSDSANLALQKEFAHMIEDRTIELLGINLRDKPYWWSTRLFLEAALVEDYTNIQRLVFVGGDGRYVGMASPRQVRLSLARPFLELKYSRMVEKVVWSPQQGISTERRVIDEWIYHYGDNEFKHEKEPVPEDSAKELVSAEMITYRVPLETFSVEWNQPLDSALLQAVVLESGYRFVPLTQRGRLIKIVNGDAFARQCATQTMRARFG